MGDFSQLHQTWGISGLIHAFGGANPHWSCWIYKRLATKSKFGFVFRGSRVGGGVPNRPTVREYFFMQT